MRSGDFAIELLPHGQGVMRETATGHVLARAGQIYAIRVRNHGPLRAVADIRIDGASVTARPLYLPPYSVVDLERPVHATECGRFTVVAEGDEGALGLDGGRDNASLGLIEATFRRELPRTDVSRDPFPLSDSWRGPDHRLVRPLPSPHVMPEAPARAPLAPRRPMAPPGWTPEVWNGTVSMIGRHLPQPHGPRSAPPLRPRTGPGDFERAAGTGLTESADQRFEDVVLGPLESEPTVITLRIVIGSESALRESAERTSTDDLVPARPAARP